MNLEIGMYVRTKRGQIGKITTIGKDNIAIEFNGMWQDVVSKTNIAKEPSFNIIDLIEEGDYVNGGEVIEMYEKGRKYGCSTYVFKQKTIEVANDDYETIPMDCLFANDEIESIVTKEQFEQMAYKIGEQG